MRMRARGGDKRAPSSKIVGTPAEIASQIRQTLKDGGSAEHAAGVQWFFKDEIKSHGWYTADCAVRPSVFGESYEKNVGWISSSRLLISFSPARYWKKKLPPSFCWKDLMASLATVSSSYSNPGWTVSAAGRITMGWCIILSLRW